MPYTKWSGKQQNSELIKEPTNTLQKSLQTSELTGSDRRCSAEFTHLYIYLLIVERQLQFPHTILIKYKKMAQVNLYYKSI